MRIERTAELRRGPHASHRAFCILALAPAVLGGCGAPDASQPPPTPPPLAAETTPVRPTSFADSPALQALADAGAWITVRTTFLPAARKGTLVEFKEQAVSAEMLTDVAKVNGSVFIDFKDCRFQAGALKPLDGLENVHALTIIDNTTDDSVLQDISSLPNLEVLITTSSGVTTQGLVVVENSTRIHYLSLSHATLGDMAVPSAAAHRALTELRLGAASITDDALRNIAQIPVLLRLDLTNCNVGDSGVRHLGSLKELRSLDLTNCKIGDSGVRYLGSLNELHRLDLDGTKITDAGLDGLRPLAKLENLNLKRTAITGSGLRRLTDLPNLQTLSLSYTLLDDDGLEGLLGLRALRRLSLRHTAVTDSGVVKLAALLNLDDLDVLATNVTATARDAFAPNVLKTGPEPPSGKDPYAK